MKAGITKPKSIFIIFIFCIVCFSLSATENKPVSSDAKEFIFYHQKPGYSPFRFIELLIKTDGYGISKFQRSNSEEGEYAFQVNEYELEALKTFVDTVNFFNQPEDDRNDIVVTDTGESVLRISLNNQKRELNYKYRPELNPLTLTLRKLYNEGIILYDLKNKGDVYSVLGAISNSLAAPKALRPEVFRKPLIEFIARTNNRQKLLDSFEALSGIMTPDEWMGLISKEIKDANEAKRTILLGGLSSHPFTGNISTVHRDTLCPVFFNYLRLEYKNWPQFFKEKQQAYNIGIINFLGQRRYQPAIPVLIELLKEEINGNIKPIPFLHNALSQMGEEVIQPLEALLESPNPNVRASAVSLLSDILASNPDWPTKNSIPENEQERILRILRTDIRPKIKKLAENDEFPLVQDFAKNALKQIDNGWRK